MHTIQGLMLILLLLTDPSEHEETNNIHVESNQNPIESESDSDGMLHRIGRGIRGGIGRGFHIVYGAAKGMIKG